MELGASKCEHLKYMLAIGNSLRLTIELPYSSSINAPTNSTLFLNYYLSVIPLTEVSIIWRNISYLYASLINVLSLRQAYSLISGITFVSMISK